MAGIYLDATQADYIRMILGCGRTVVPCQFRGTLRPCVRIECIAAVQRAYGFSRNLDGTLPLVSKRPEKYRQVNPTLVRTQHLPLPAETARELGIPGLAGCCFRGCEVPLCPWESGCFQLCTDI